MMRISSRSTFFYKRVFPISWFGLLFIFAIHAAFATSPGGGISIGYFVGLTFAGVGGFLFMMITVFDLADEVFDVGNAVIVRVGTNKRLIPLAEVADVKYSPRMSPPRVVLTLKNPSKFGKEVAFSAPLTILPFAKSPMITSLIDRIGQNGG